jgi:hypothetical protein
VGPATAIERVEVASSRGWLGRVAVVAVGVLAFQAFTLWAAVDGPDGRWLYGGLAAATLVLSSALVVGVLRALRARPVIELTDDALLMCDGRVLYRAFDVLRPQVRAAAVLDLPHPTVGRAEFGLSPCAEPWNLRITFDGPVLCLVARSGPWGNWFWPWVLPGGGRIRPPRRLHAYEGVLVRAVDPERAQRQLTTWAAGDHRP